MVVHGCTLLYLAVPGCTWLQVAIPGCIWLFLAVPGCTWLFLAVPGCFSSSYSTFILSFPLNLHFTCPDSFLCHPIILLSFHHSRIILIPSHHSHVIPSFWSHSIFIHVILQSFSHSHIICHHLYTILWVLYAPAPKSRHFSCNQLLG